MASHAPSGPEMVRLSATGVATEMCVQWTSHDACSSPTDAVVVYGESPGGLDSGPINGTCLEWDYGGIPKYICVDKHLSLSNFFEDAFFFGLFFFLQYYLSVCTPACPWIDRSVCSSFFL